MVFFHVKEKTGKEKKLLIVTGAAGFIGSCLVKHLNQQNQYRLLLVDTLKRADKWKNLVGKKFEAIISKEEIFRFLEGRAEEIFGFIHLGACSDTTANDAEFLLENNYRYTVKLAEYALENNLRFIYASSAATYGNGLLGFSDDESRLEELRPLNMYGYSKHLFDLWIAEQNLLGKVVGLKYFNVFGPNEYHKGRMASMIYHMFLQIKKEGCVKLFRSNDPAFLDGDQCRDFIYVKDVARMTADFLNNDHCGIFNIGRGEAVTWNFLAKALFDAMGKKVNIQYIDLPQDLIGQYQNYTCAEMKKYQTLYPQHQTMQIQEAVKEYATEYLMRNERW
jgi:ADP-L-glycero-D-manno-heptose 6-epimerase